MILLQAYTILFAVALAWLNKVPCEKMISYGASIREERLFHAANSAVKILFIATVCLLTKLFIAAPLLWLIYWVVFDCTLGIFLHGNPFYIGQTAWTDKQLKKHLGEYAGVVKLVTCCSLIMVINFFL